jgi:hypothetical protein
MAVHASAILYVGSPPGCAYPDCEWPGTWVFKASGPDEVHEVILGRVLVETGDDFRLCDLHAEALRVECERRDDSRVNLS